jgi:hypothetical protein
MIVPPVFFTRNGIVLVINKNRTRPGPYFRHMIFEKRNRCLCILFAMAFAVIGFAPIPVSSQKVEFFDVKPVIRDVQKRFRLTAKDVSYVSPLIRQDNSDLLMIYNRFGGPAADYSTSLWREIADQRSTFETRMGSHLTRRQETAVRSARGALERRVIGRVRNDYLDFVIAELELDDIEIEAVNHIFQKDSDTKLALVSRYHRQPEVLEKELERSTIEMESWMLKVLSPEQMRLYRSLSPPSELLIAVL